MPSLIRIFIFRHMFRIWSKLIVPRCRCKLRKVACHQQFKARRLNIVSTALKRITLFLQFNSGRCCQAPTVRNNIELSLIHLLLSSTVIFAKLFSNSSEKKTLHQEDIQCRRQQKLLESGRLQNSVFLQKLFSLLRYHIPSKIITD